MACACPNPYPNRRVTNDRQPAGANRSSLASSTLGEQLRQLSGLHTNTAASPKQTWHCLACSAVAIQRGPCSMYCTSTRLAMNLQSDQYKLVTVQAMRCSHA